MTIDEIKAEIRQTEIALQPLARKLELLRQDLRDSLSAEFIRVNGITSANVQRMEGDGVPYFGHVNEFAKWLKAQPNPLPWCEWNTMIMRTSDVIAGKWVNTGAYTTDLP